MINKELVFLGIDLGTSSIKLVLINSRLKLVFLFHKEYAIQSPAPGFAEHDPEIWVCALEIALKQVSNFLEINQMQLEGIGITGQMHTLVCLDKELKPVRNAILWSDQRTTAIVERLNSQYAKNQWKDWIANPLAVGFSFPSWLWIRENEKSTAKKIKYLLQPKY